MVANAAGILVLYPETINLGTLKLIGHFLQLLNAFFALKYTTFNTSQDNDIVGTKLSDVKLSPQIFEQMVKVRQVIVDASDVRALVLQSAAVHIKTFHDLKSERNDARNP
ncbi:hypothetical protein COL26b_012047 [Colletotrichum chrysophilum]|uniref:uncharacterized protein n=1 Tax=Colletotrichum chrysophilum TaxID=1836956 RepID=UPI002301F4F4|nr:uncharacterized protein COL26b_012047 [Colletotrichum chrysophilum]KAJ0365474.1 hypothetical protein COL26b_012047 [Colletotrichum chrysophilum]